MITSFGTPEYLDQLNDTTQPQAGDTENRTVLQTARDYITDALVRPTLSVARTVTTGARAATTDMSQPPGFWEEADKAVGSAQDYVKEEWRSDRAKALDNVSPFGTPGTRDFWREPIAASIHTFLPSVPYAIAGILSGGGTLAAGALTAAGGVFGGTEAIQELRDFADRTPVKKTPGAPISLEEIPVWADYMREFNGDERAAREKLFQDSLKPGTLAFNYFVNALEVPAILKGYRAAGTRGPTPRQRLVGGVQGAAIGGTQGALEGGTESLIEQQAKVQRGEQTAIDYAEIEKGMATGSTFGGMTAAIHTVSPQMRDAAKASIGQTMRATSIDASELATLGGQIDDQRSGDPTRGKPGAFTIDQAVAQMPVVGHAGSLTGQMDDIGQAPRVPGEPGTFTPGGVPQEQALVQPEAAPDFNAPGGVGPQAPVMGAGMGRFDPRFDDTDYGYGTGTPMIPPPPASDQSRPSEEAPLDISGEPTFQFRTAKGSVYNQFDDGTTIRNKAPRREHGNDQGLKARSQATFFITPQHAKEMGGLFQATSRFGKRIARASTGQWGVQYTEGPSAGKFERRTLGRVSPTPVVGMTPVELWRDGSEAHFGNPVTEVRSLRQAEQPAEAAPQAQPVLKDRQEPVQGELPLPGRILRPPWDTRATRPKPTPPLQVDQPPSPTDAQRNAQALAGATAPKRTGKPTGLERSFETARDRYLGNAYAQTQEFWDQLNRRAVALDRSRSKAGLEPKNYAAQLGRRPEDPEILQRQRQQQREQEAEKARLKRDAEHERKYTLPSERKKLVEAGAKQGWRRAAEGIAKATARAAREAADKQTEAILHRFEQRMAEAKRKADAPARAKAEAEARAEMLKAYITRATRLKGKHGVYSAKDRRRAATVSERLKARRQWVPGKGYIYGEAYPAQLSKQREAQAKADKNVRRLYRPQERPAAGPTDIGELHTEDFKNRAFAKQIADRILRRVPMGERIKRARMLTKLPLDTYDRLVTWFGKHPDGIVKDWEELIRILHPQAEQVAREQAEVRTREGKPVRPSQATPKVGTVEEAIQKFREGRRTARQTERQKGLSGAHARQRETEVQRVLRNALKKFAGGSQRMGNLAKALYLYNARQRGRTPERKRGETAKFAPRKYVANKERQIEIMKVLTAFWSKAFDQMNADMAQRKAQTGVGDSRAPLRLARRHAKMETVTGPDGEPMQQAVPGRFRFQSGVERPENSYFNFTTDLQNLNEEMRYVIDQIEERKKAGIGTNELAAEYQKQFAILGPMIDHFYASWQLYQAGDMEGMSELRGIRNQQMEISRPGNTLSLEELEAKAGAVPAEEREEGYGEQVNVGEQSIGGRTPGVDVGMTTGRGDTERSVGNIVAGASVVRKEMEDVIAQDEENRRAFAAGEAPRDVTGQEQIDPATIEGNVPARTISGGSRAAVMQNRNVVEQQTVDVIAAKAKAEMDAMEKATAGKPLTAEEKEALARGREQAARLARIKAQAPPLPPAKRFTGKVRAQNLYANFDDDGIATEGRPDAPTSHDLTPQQQPYADAYNALNSADPTHPLIQPAETAEQVFTRVKYYLSTGQLRHFLPKYINERFLDRLARVVSDVPTYHAPYDAVTHFGQDSGEHYSQEHDRVVLANNVMPERYARSAIHEHVHAALTWLLKNDQRFSQSVYDLWKKARDTAVARGFDVENDHGELTKAGLYGLTDPQEFLTESSTNQRFRDFLDTIDSPRGHGVIEGARTALNSLYRAVRDTLRRVMGAYDGNTALDAFYYDQSTVLGRADAMLERGFAELERKGRKPALAPGPGKGHASFGGEGKNYMAFDGTRKFLADVLGDAKAGVSERADAARHAWNTIDKNRGIGLLLHTLHDMSQRGSPAFRALFAKAKEYVERQHTERGRIMREIDAPKLARMGKFLNALNKEDRAEAQDIIIDESNLGAYVDVDLNDQKNKHLHKRLTKADRAAGITATQFADTLRNSQIKEEHAKLKARYDAFVAKHPEMAGIREMVHSWARERDTIIRQYRIASLIKAADIAHPDTPKAAFDAIEKMVTDPASLTPAEGRLVIDNLVADPRSNTPEGRRVIKELHAIYNTPDLSQIAGPYTPFTRRGNYALSGRLKIPPPPNGIMLNPGSLNRKTGEPTGQPRFVFKTIDEAKQHIRDITDKYGAKLLKAGEIYIDDRTNEPAMGDDPDNPDEQVRLKGKDLDAAIKAGEPISKQYYVQYQTKIVSFHPTERAATKAREDWIAQKGGDIEMNPPQDVEEFDSRQNVLYVSTQLENMIRTARASDFYQHTLTSNASRGAFTDMLNRAAEQYTHNRGLSQRYLPRGYVQGMSRDLMENYSEWSGVTAGYMAKEKFDNQIIKSLQALKNYVREDDTKMSLLHGRLYNELEKRLHSPKTNPRDTEANRLLDRGLRTTMIDKLVTPGYFAVQVTEPGMVAAPLMMGRHNVKQVLGTMAGMYKVAEASSFMKEGWKDILQAIRRGEGARFDWLSLFSEKLKDELDSDRMTDLMTQARDRNMFDVTSSLEYDKAFTSSRNKFDRALDWVTGIFQAANTTIENLNRFVTLGTAYRLEYGRLLRAGGADADLDAIHQQAVEYALGISHEANGVYSNYNAPPIFNSTAIGRMFFQFKKYPQRILANYIRAASGAVKGDTERARQLVAMLAIQGLMAGALGLPTELFAIPLNGLYLAGISPYNFDDVQRGFRQWSAQNFGKEGGELLSHGILRLSGTDIASRMSQSSLLTFGNIESTKPKDVQAAIFTMLSGALGSTAMEGLQGVQKLGSAVSAYSSGSWSKGMDHLLDASRLLVPFRAYVDVMDAIRKSSVEGMRTAAGAEMREPYGPFEAITRGLGVTPAREAESSEARRARATAATRYRAARKDTIDIWVQSTPSERVALQGRIDNFNDSVPVDQRITRSDLLKALGVRQKAERQPPSNLGLPIDRRTRQFQDLNAAYNM